jgi:hypothetical protein
MLRALFTHMCIVFQVTHILIALAISLCSYQHQWKRSNDVAQVTGFILNFVQNESQFQNEGTRCNFVVIHFTACT